MIPKHIIRFIARVALIMTAFALVTPDAMAHRPGRGPHKHPHKPGQPGEKLSKDDVKDRLKKVRKRHKARKEARKDHRKERRAEIRKSVRKHFKGKKFGKKVGKQMRNELTVHSKRMARLRRIQFVAAKKDDFETVEKVDALIAREQNRHQTWWSNAAKLAEKD